MPYFVCGVTSSWLKKNTRKARCPLNSLFTNRKHNRDRKETTVIFTKSLHRKLHGYLLNYSKLTPIQEITTSHVKHSMRRTRGLQFLNCIWGFQYICRINLFCLGKANAQYNYTVLYQGQKQLIQAKSYLYSCCHCSSCCQIQPLPSKIHHGLIASFFGLYNVLVNLLKAKHT